MVARAVALVEGRRVGGGEGLEQRTDRIGVVAVERLVGHQRAHRGDSVGRVGARLHREPLVDDVCLLVGTRSLVLTR